jgi:hypothetical protein
MQTKRMRVVVLLIAGFVFLSACRKPVATNQIANSNAASPSPEAVFGGGAAVTGERFYFRGTIANNLKIEMTLVRDRDQLTGTYFYPRAGKNIDLKGSIDKDGNLDLRETDETGKETGIFKGKWKPATDEPDVGLSEIEGKWSRPDGSKETNFQITQQPIEFSATVRMVSKTIREANKEKHYTIAAEYPRLKATRVSIDSIGKRAIWS